MQQIDMVAPTGATVLIQGETGTGKELIAQAIHDMSPRRNGPLVKVNCAAIPSGLIESELFGHERGAFTGALTQRIGCFERANGGTLFLDEIGDMTPELQAKLLRVLQEQEFQQVGAMRSTHVDVRLVAATNRDLFQMMMNKEFRADLYYRVSVFPIAAPPLRDRPEDIPVLARHFIALYSERMNKMIDDIDLQTIDAMVAYHWPGNVRQLQNFIEHGVIITQGRIFRPALSQLQSPSTSSSSGPKTLDEATRDHILQTLQETKWVVGGRQGAAARLGLARTTLIAKMRRLGIDSAPGEMLMESSNRQRAFSATA
jgi:formate hydrogenlyase transcriptional activator